jgi:type II secretory pathway pseudopilin PulG
MRLRLKPPNRRWSARPALFSTIAASNLSQVALKEPLNFSGNALGLNRKEDKTQMKNLYTWKFKKAGGKSMPPLTAWLKNQRGAMFGLDARIALAIFGVLSVVGGYSATTIFKDAQITQLSTELSNLKKAYQEFYLSTGDHTNRFMDLIKNDYDVVGWRGPYTDLLSDKSRIYDGVYSLMEGRQDVAGVPPVECTGGICSMWLKLTKVKDSVAADLDDRLDAEPSPNSGVLRIEFQQGGTDDIYFLVTAKH